LTLKIDSFGVILANFYFSPKAQQNTYLYYKVLNSSKFSFLSII